MATPWLALLAGPLSYGIAAPALLLDDLARATGTGEESAAAGVTAFGWGIALGTPLLAALLARRGVRAVLTVAAALVAAGTLLLVLVPSMPALVVGAAVQALGSAGLTVTAMKLADSARQMGVVAASLAVVGATGPLTGALVADISSWQVALALPLLAVLAVPAARRGSTSPDAAPASFDPLGMALLAMLVTAAVLIPHRPLVTGPATVALLLLLVTWIKVRPDGFLSAAVARNGRFLAACVLAFALGVVNFALLYSAPDLLRQHAGWESTRSGIVLLAPYLLGGFCSAFLVAASGRVPRRVTAAALLATGAAATLLAAATTAVPLLLAAMALGSLAAATGQGVLALHATGVVSASHRAEALGLFNLAYLLSVAFGPAIAVALSHPTA
ncbi:MFS transporter [Micromonospora peucetia]|uniref:MFS transporter n=1 Tax=Micromonospora peucetia TaxID=47871 RepID=A0ABZ1EHH5_9ACTN|nr:MFS transporter [Micromonospora peucetia]MCX4385781.1 MFS transporter [Micromonospora peucetia]WSA33168.1 MFS transporter [Micromonospora peucetia]